MMRSISVSVRVVVVAAVLLVCAGCAPLGPGSGGSAADSSESTSESTSGREFVVEAVQAADPAATAVVAKEVTSGLSKGWSIEIDHEGEVTADTLAGILRGVAESDLKPVDITLSFFAPGTDDPLEIRSAADELGVPWTPVGSGASWLTGQLGDLPT
jgi:hypothetical protein